MVVESGQVDEIRPCLIGGFRDKIVPPSPLAPLPEGSCEVPRFEPWLSPDGCVCSLDMVRMRLKFSGNDDSIARFEDRVQRFDSLSDSYSMTRSSVGRYAHLHRLTYGDSTVSLGVGQFVRGAKADMHRGFLEFNPNKVAGDASLSDFLRVVSAASYRCELVRYDLAVDFPVARRKVRTRKDRRLYQFVQGASLTEYLGQRNTAGYVKVYDKAAELGLDGVDLTRVEMTCSGGWSVGEVLDKWPVVYSAAADGGDATDVNAVVALMAAELMDSGGSPEKYIAKLDKRRRAKVRRLIEGIRFDCPELGAAHVLMQAIGWCEAICSEVGQ